MDRVKHKDNETFLNVLSEACDSVKTINIPVPQLPETDIYQVDDILLNDLEFGTSRIDDKINDNSSKLIESVVDHVYLWTVRHGSFWYNRTYDLHSTYVCTFIDLYIRWMAHIKIRK